MQSNTNVNAVAQTQTGAAVQVPALAPVANDYFNEAALPAQPAPQISEPAAQPAPVITITGQELIAGNDAAQVAQIAGDTVKKITGALKSPVTILSAALVALYFAKVI